MDKDGYANPIISLGEIGFGGDLVLPLSINFSSAVRLPSPEFGQGWACPLFDSKIVDVQKNLKRVTLLGGKDIYLIYNPRDDTWSHYYDSNWTGKAEGDDFELKYVNGCQFHFHKGRILSLTTAAGRTVVWNRTGDKLDSLQEPNKPLALEIKRDGFGFAKQILLHPDALGIWPRNPDLEKLSVGIFNQADLQQHTLADLDSLMYECRNPFLAQANPLHKFATGRCARW